MKRVMAFLVTLALTLVQVGCSQAAPPAGGPAATTAPQPSTTQTPAAAPAQTGQPAPASPAAPKPVRVIVPDRANLQFLNLWVALGAGYFQEEGLDVQVVVPPNPQASPQLLLQGQGDVALLQPPIYIQQIAQGQPILVFANLLQNDPINLIVRKEVAEARKLDPDAPLAERLKGLQGLRIGVAPNPPTRLRILFASAGMDIDRDIQTVILGEERQRAFAGNPVDALYAHTPFLEKALVEQGAVLLVNQSRGDIPEVAGLAGHALVTTRDYAAAKPDVVLALTRGVYRAQQLIHADLKAAADALFRSGVDGLERRFVETLLPIYQPAIPKTPKVDIAAIQKSNANFFPLTRGPADLSKVNLADYIAPQFAEQAVTRGP